MIFVILGFIAGWIVAAACDFIRNVINNKNN